MGNTTSSIDHFPTLRGLQPITEDLLVEFSPSSKFFWRIPNFSKLGVGEDHYSDVFVAGDCRWRVLIYVTEMEDGPEKYLNIKLCSLDSSKLPYAEFSFTVVSQRQSSARESVKLDGGCQFCPTFRNRGWVNFMDLNMMNHPRAGYLVNDTCIIRVKVSVCPMATSRNDSIKALSSKQEEAELHTRASSATPVKRKEDPIKASKPEPEPEPEPELEPFHGSQTNVDSKRNEEHVTTPGVTTVESSEIKTLPNKGLDSYQPLGQHGRVFTWWRQQGSKGDKQDFNGDENLRAPLLECDKQDFHEHENHRMPLLEKIISFFD